MGSAKRVLIVEDDDSQRQAMQIQLSREGYETSSAADVAQAIPILEKSPQHLVLADLNLPDESGIDLLKKVHSEYPEATVIIMTAYGTIERAVEAMKAGAYDFIVKPIYSAELKILVSRALDHQQLAEEVQILKGCLDRKFGFEQIIGSSESLLRALDIAARVAETDATVLIRGETGTGKEMVAKAIHLRSARRERPFMTVNCGAIPKELLESELFGHVKGSFTGALNHKKGKVEIAEGGTVLLDEIGEMPLELQVRILRLIQEREIEKVGATTPTKVNVRIIAATHRDLATMAKEGGFRQLFKGRGGCCAAPTGDGTSACGRVSLPGNVREMEHGMERMVILSTGSKLTIDDLPEFLRSERNPAKTLMFDEHADKMSLVEVEKNLVLDVLRQFRGNQTRTARYLDMSRRTLSYRLEKYGITNETLKSMRRDSPAHENVQDQRTVA